MTIRKIIRTSQPQTPCGIDWSNPITRGLINAIVPGTISADLVTSTAFSNTSKLAVNNKIVAATTGVSNGLKTNSLPILNVDATILWFGSINQLTSTGQLLTNRWAYSATGIPIGLCSYTGPNRVGFNIVGTANSLFMDTSHTISTPVLYVALRHGAIAKIFENGFLGNQGTFNTVAVTNSTIYPITFGAISAATNSEKLNGNHFLGCIWSRALSDIEVKSISDNPWQIFQPTTRILYTPNQDIILPSKAYPVKDLAKGLWTGFSPDNINTSLVDKIDETALDTSDYIYTDYPSTMEFELSETQFPGTGGYQLSYNVASSVGAIATVVMRQGMIEIAKWEHSLTNTDDTYTQTLTSEQIARITAGPITVSIDTRQPS